MNKGQSLSAEQRNKTILSVVLGIICVIYVLPVLTVVLNSFKVNTFVKTDTFAIPKGEMWAGFQNFLKGMTFGLQRSHYHPLHRAHPPLHIHGCMVYCPRQLYRLQGDLLPVRVLHGGSFPDGHVHPLQDG